MANKTAISKAVDTLIPVTTDEPVGYKDLGYKSARLGDSQTSLKVWARNHIKGFPDNIADDIQSEIKEGMRQRCAEINPPIEYGVVEGKYIPLSELASRPKEVIKIGVEYAYSYTQQQFGKLKGENPSLHAVIAEVRSKTSTYVSNRYKDLTKKEPTKREKGANKDFDEFVEFWFKETAPDRLKSAKSRGDLTADDKRFSKAKVAFMTAWHAK